jgi:LmbE family N-acetylglucosaminyl deacetylase
MSDDESAESANVVVPVNDLPYDGSITHDLETPNVALAIGAHPDDIEFGCGATLAKWAAAGCRIHHLVLTDGAKGTWDPKRDPATLIAVRQEEQREAAHRLGGSDVGFLGWPDGELRNGVREQWEVSRWIRTVKPDVVLGHDPWRRYRLHPDHRNAGFIVTDSLVAARDAHFFADQDLAPHRPRALLLWEADVPNHVEDVSSSVEAKINALLAHQSQYASTMGIEAEDSTDTKSALERFAIDIRTQLGTHGAVGGIPLGESFHLMTDI